MEFHYEVGGGKCEPYACNMKGPRPEWKTDGMGIQERSLDSEKL